MNVWRSRTAWDCSIWHVCSHFCWTRQSPGFLCCKDRCLHKKQCTFKKPDQEVIVALVVLGKTLDFVKSRFDADLREFVRSLFHVIDCEVIGLQELEVVNSQSHNGPNLEVSIAKISSFSFVLMFLSLKEFSSPNTRVLVSILVHLNSVISSEEGNNELSIVLIFILRNQSCLKP